MLTTDAQPLVVDLDGNGQAEIVFLTVGAFAQRRIVAVNGATGAVVWAVNAYQPAANPMLKICFTFCEMAAADLDGDGRIEILAVHSDDETSMLRRRLVAFNYDGTHRWTSDDILDGVNVLQTAGILALHRRPRWRRLTGDSRRFTMASRPRRRRTSLPKTWSPSSIGTATSSGPGASRADRPTAR